jgi:acetyl-CoA acetyltransferase
MTDRIAIVGIGITKLGSLPDESGTMLASEAMRAAVADASLKRSDIDGVVCQPGHGYGSAGAAARRLGLPMKFFVDLQSGGASAIHSIVFAAGVLREGLADYVLSVYATKARTARTLVGASQDETANDGVWGMFSPGARNAMRARYYLERHGLASDAFWPVVKNQREHANRRPDALMYGKAVTFEEYVSEPFVAEPFRRLDYTQMSDGAAAFVITTESRARDLPKPPVLVLGAGLAQAGTYAARGGTDYDSDLDEFISEARGRAFGQAGVSLDDIDVAELYDPFSIYPIMQVEAYGWAGRGEGSDFFREGRGTLGGDIPVNTHGGHLSWGYLQGYGSLLEGVRQLRGEAESTQVEGARVALVTGSGEGSAGSPVFANLILGAG